MITKYVASDGCTRLCDYEAMVFQGFCADCREHMFIDGERAIWLARNRDLELVRCESCRDKAIEAGTELGVITPDRNTLVVNGAKLLKMLGLEN